MKNKLLKKGSVLFALAMFFAMPFSMNAQSGETCDDALVVSSLPFNDSGNTEDYGDNYGSSDVPDLIDGAIGNPSSSYLNGDDVVYAYTSTTDSFIDITVSDHGSYAGVFVFTGCSFESTVGGDTSASSTDDLEVKSLPVEAGETYYIVISTWAAPQSTSYTLDIIETTFDCPILDANIGDPCDDGDPTTTNDVINEDCECEGQASIPGEICSNPIEITTLPYATTDNTENYGDHYGSSDIPDLIDGAIGNPSPNYLNGDEAVYAYTPTENQIIDISVTEHGTWTGVFVFTGCPFESTVGGDTNSSDTAELLVEQLSVEAGETYYIVISTYASPQSTPYTLNITKLEDCEGTPDAGSVMIDPINGNPDTTYTVSAEEFTIANGLSFQWQSNTNDEGWEDEGDATNAYSPYTATAPSELGVDVEWRLALTCVVSEETVYSEVATFTTAISYCVATHSTVEAITKVVFAGIDNASSGESSSDSYEDFTDIVAEVESGETYSFAAEGNTNGNYTNHFTVWIDWNQNGELEDTEMYEIGSIVNSDGTDDQQAISDILVPEDALLGETRMRVRKNFSSSLTTPCGPSTYGQTEDYTVNVGGEEDEDEDGFPAPYCNITDAEEVIVEEITKVDFAGTSITNEDTDTVLINKTDTVINVTAGNTYTISVEGNTYDTEFSFDSNIVAFIDWDQNEILNDEGEVYEIGTLSGSTGNDGTSVTMEITIPADAVLGETRVRITKTYTDEDSVAEINPCGIEFDVFGVMVVPGYGQALDFTLNIEESNDEEITYCTPMLDCADGDSITNVTFLEIDNTTTCSPDGYGDYTSMTATVQSGGTYPISVSVGDGWAYESASVWIDFDESGTFDEDEFFYIGTGSDEALTSEIFIPETVANGNYRMRVRVSAVGEDTATWDMACDEEQGYGETEDYTVIVDGIMGMEDNTITNFTYYPNPMEDVLNITANLDIKSVAVFNVLGQEILGNNHFTDNKVDVSALPTGTFIFRVTFENGSTKSFKAVKK